MSPDGDTWTAGALLDALRDGLRLQWSTRWNNVRVHTINAVVGAQRRARQGVSVSACGVAKHWRRRRHRTRGDRSAATKRIMATLVLAHICHGIYAGIAHHTALVVIRNHVIVCTHKATNRIGRVAIMRALPRRLVVKGRWAQMPDRCALE